MRCFIGVNNVLAGGFVSQAGGFSNGFDGWFFQSGFDRCSDLGPEAVVDDLLATGNTERFRGRFGYRHFLFLLFQYFIMRQIETAGWYYTISALIAQE